MENEEQVEGGLKRYRTLILIVIVLMIIGIGCWLVEKRDVSKDDSRKDDFMRKLDQPKSNSQTH